MKEKLFNMILLNFSYSDLRAENYTRCFLQLIVAATTLMVFADIFLREIIFSKRNFNTRECPKKGIAGNYIFSPEVC